MFIVNALKKHPAVMNDDILRACKNFLPDERIKILDPFAGIGTTAEYFTEHDVVGVEIEKEWASQNKNTICGDSLVEIPKLGKFDAIITSPCYGNRMADDFNQSKENTRKYITYKHFLERKLTEGTTANLHFGRKNKLYEEFHKNIWKVSVDSLKDEGLFILNCKDFISNGEVMKVTKWHINTLKSFGLTHVKTVKVKSKGMRFGANYNLRLDYEYVVCLKKLSRSQRFKSSSAHKGFSEMKS